MIFPHPRRTEHRIGPSLVGGAALLAMLAVFPVGTQAGQSDPAASESEFKRFLDVGEFELAAKIAIKHFRPDLHCEVYLEQAKQTARAAQSLMTDLESAAEAEESSIVECAKRLQEAEAFHERALRLARNYVDAGWEAALLDRVRDRLASEKTRLDDLLSRLEAVRGRAKSLDSLFILVEISADDISRLPDHDKLVLGLYLADRGLFERARRECLEPVILEGDKALSPVAGVARELLQQWHIPATHNRKWDNLVNKALDAYEQLRRESPAQSVLAGWLLSLTAHLARDHYDVPLGTINDTLELLKQADLPRGEALGDRLLSAKISHERFLISRRAGLWDAPLPPADHLKIFIEANDPWYAAEAALIAAGASEDSSAAREFMQQCEKSLEKIRAVEPRLADALQKKVDRYMATTKPFEEWLACAMSRDYQDRRGTVLPEIMVETRAQLARRVRAGFEESILKLIAEERTDAAFQEAQKAKALTVGRIATPVTADALIASKLLAQGTGGEMQIPKQELFIELFFGPTKAWAFYAFAPGDVYEALQVVELDRRRFAQSCADTIARLQRGEETEDPGSWLMNGSPSLSELWDRLEDLKKSNRLFRRVVIAPDGPACYLPLHSIKAFQASKVTYLPTAAVLGSSDILDSRDVKLMWDSQRGELAPDPPGIKRKLGQYQIGLWKGVFIPIELQDVPN